MKTAYHYSFKSLIFTGTSRVYKDNGYDDCVLPQFSTWAELPSYNPNTEQCRYNKDIDAWHVEPIPVAVTAYNKDTLEPKKFSDKSEVTDEYTRDKPATQFDEWVDGAGFVTNETKQYEYNYNVVDAARRSAYVREVSPLLEEVQIKRLIGTDKSISEAEILEAQAVAARAQIQAENPWPVEPEA